MLHTRYAVPRSRRADRSWSGGRKGLAGSTLRLCEQGKCSPELLGLGPGTGQRGRRALELSRLQACSSSARVPPEVWDEREESAWCVCMKERVKEFVGVLVHVRTHAYADHRK